MKKTLFLLSFVCCIITACNNYDDFEFSGTVVDYELCTGFSDFGYAVSLTAPDTIGGTYLTSDNVTTTNTVIIYGSDRLLHAGDHISGRIYLDPNFSKSTCNYHYPNRDVPEAVFTELKTIIESREINYK